MSLKKATLISLVGVSLYTCISIIWFFYQSILTEQMHQPAPLWVHMMFWVLNVVLFNGSIILFLSVLYSKQRKMDN